ncbi:MAG: DEAD/DEAH box helicase, partial [Candidatus Thorarchaeota archaeon]
MPVLHCPTCGSRLDIRKAGGIWTVICSSCASEVSVGGAKTDLFDAYEAYVEQTKSGTIAKVDYRKKKYLGSGTDRPKERKRRRDETSRVQSKNEIEQLVQAGGGTFSDLPESLQKLLFRGRDYLVQYKLLQATDAEYGDTVENLSVPTRLKDYLQDRGISQLYKFQEESYSAIENGENVVIAAPTGQGKTEGFILPIIRKILLSVQDSFENPGVRALLIYPTKA